MSKNRTVAKQRLDKYYTLAKEKGYRARSAFKLQQLNHKYGFLKDAHILIDLCAAPGGWLQIAAEEMPRPRKIIGMDLDPIKYIGEVDTYVCDITSTECRKILHGELDGRFADVVLHDGAPNVGTSWENDSFNQNVLVVYSLRIVRIFLRPGGTFVTKIFRSKDYDALIGVCGKMFKRVEATKPLSSRSQSAEIFVVCSGYLGCDSVDENMLELSNVFADIKYNEEDDDGEFIDCKYVKMKFTEFMKSTNPKILDLLTEIEVDIDQNDVKKILNDEFLYLFKDIKVISDAEKKKIMREKAQIIKMIRKGDLSIAGLEFLIKEKETIVEDVPLTLDERIDQIEAEMEDNKRYGTKTAQLNKNNDFKKIDTFFDDKIFDFADMDSQEEMQEEDIKEEFDESTCSDSLDLDEEDMLCLAKYKENPEEFIEDTVDRYCRDPDENLDNFLKYDDANNLRVPKLNESRLTKKEKEALLRKKSRAERRAKKFMEDLVVEDSDEEREIAKERYKVELKKQRNKSRIVFPKKASFGIPKGKGKLIFFDKRMKKDKKNKK